MRIERLRVQEGFLDGLDLEFSPGLNVLIGSRGCGKTSIIELIRFCLGVPCYSEKAAEASRAHALGVLGPGRVTVDVNRDGKSESYSRTASTGGADLSREPHRPIILSQNQVELLGSDQRQLLRLIDEFTPTSRGFLDQERRLSASIESLSAEIRSKRDEWASLVEQATSFRGAPEQLKTAEATQTEATGALESMKPVQAELNKVSRDAAAAGVRGSTLNSAVEVLGRYKSELQATFRCIVPLPPWPGSAGGPDLLEPIRSTTSEVRRLVERSLAEVQKGLDELQALIATNAREREELEGKHLSLRKAVDEVQAGAGEAAQHVARLRSQVAQLHSLVELSKTRQDELNRLRAERNQVLDELDAIRQRRFEARSASAALLVEQLGPAIRVDVRLFGLQSNYREDLTAILRGSGLRYSSLVPAITEAMSPRELVDAIEEGDAERVAELAGIPADRAMRAVAYLASEGGEQLLVSALEDRVDLSLLDGRAYKALDQLSTGQRCTVILPIFLAHPVRPIIVDQPEDNLDNAFIVTTLVKALRGRRTGDGGQLLIATHNANIPVLGEAERVVHLGSDGKRGFVLSAEPLDAAASVEAITTVMEGGREAFARRAEFYGVDGLGHG